MALQFLNNGYFAGKVGIGTDNPSEKLEVQGGNIKIETTTNTDAKLILNSYSSALGSTYQWEVVSASSANSYNFQIREAGQAYLTIDNSVGGQTGNIGIGTTSPSYKLHVNGGDAQIANGIAGTLYMNNANNYLYGDVNGVGIIGVGDNFRIKTNAAERMRVTSAGNVGIGLTTPTANLHIESTNDGMTNGLSTNQLKLNYGASVAGAGSSLAFGVSSVDSFTGAKIVHERTGSNSVGDLSFWTRSTAGGGSDWDLTVERMRIDSSGNVGIGTTSPGYKLDVNGTFRSTGAGAIQGKLSVGTSSSSDIDMLRAGGNYITATNAAGVLYFRTVNDIRMTILANGNVGIGTTNPGSKLSIDSVSQDALAINSSDGDGPYAVWRRQGVSMGFVGNSNALSLSGNTNFGVRATNDLVFAAGGASEKMRIDSTGNVGIGTDSPSEKLDVVGNIELNGALYIGSRGIYQQENTDVSGLELVANASTSLYRAAFFDYVIQKTGNVRAGTVFACNDGGSVEYTETSTNDLGDTSDVVLSVDISGGNMRLLADAATSGWSVKSLIRAI